ncbi:MAG: hypothetical protein ACRDO9_00865 [Gaiellales bacterium]
MRAYVTGASGFIGAHVARGPPAYELEVSYKRTKLEAEQIVLEAARDGLDALVVTPTTPWATAIASRGASAAARSRSPEPRAGARHGRPRQRRRGAPRTAAHVLLVGEGRA